MFRFDDEKFEEMIKKEINKSMKKYIILIPTLTGEYHETILLEKVSKK